MKLVCVRNVQAGPVFEFWGQSNRKKAAVFPERSTAESAAVKTINEINKRWEGIQTYEFRVLPNKE